MEPVKRELRVKLDDVTYVLTLANASPALEMVLSLGPMLEELTFSMGRDGDVREFPLGKILKGLASPEFRTMREFLQAHIAVSREGAQPYRLSEEATYAAHLDAYPHHYMPLMMKAFTFQFARFFPAGGLAKYLPEALRARFPTAMSTGFSIVQ